MSKLCSKTRCHGPLSISAERSVHSPPTQPQFSGHQRQARYSGQQEEAAGGRTDSSRASTSYLQPELLQELPPSQQIQGRVCPSPSPFFPDCVVTFKDHGVQGTIIFHFPSASPLSVGNGARHAGEDISPFWKSLSSELLRFYNFVIYRLFAAIFCLLQFRLLVNCYFFTYIYSCFISPY